MEKKPHYVASSQPRAQTGAADARNAMLERIRKTIVTSRLTLAGDAAGGDPYDSRRGCGPGAVWGNRGR